MKNRTEVPAEKLKLSKIPEKLQTYLMVDFITKLLVVAEKNTILVVCDRLSKIMYFIATMEETSAEGLARLFKDNVQKLHRLLESIVLNSIKIVDGRLYFIFSFQFYCTFILFYFSFFYFQNNSGQGLSVTLSHQSQIDGVVTRLITRLGRMEQKVLE